MSDKVVSFQQKKEEKDNQALDELNVTVKTYVTLAKAGITTVGQIRTKSYEDLMKITGMSDKIIEDLENVLSKKFKR